MKTEVVFLVLAAGFSRRFATSKTAQNKLEAVLGNGKSVLQQTLETLQSVSSSICVVTNKQVPSTSVNLAAFPVPAFKVVECVSQGLGESIASGVAATEHAQGWVLCLADMPYISREVYLQLLNQIEANPENIIRPRWQQQSGHPVYFPRQFFDELRTLAGDKGAKSIVDRHNDAAIHFDVDEIGVTQDIDTVSDLQRLNSQS